MSSKTATKAAKIANQLCEHGEVPSACLDCLAMPKKVVLPPQPAPRATKSPSSVNDKISPLTGDLDVSVPVHSLDDVVGSETLAARAFPHYLRKGGWIYFRGDGKLNARVKALKVIWQLERTDPANPEKNLGAGIAIELDKTSWDTEVEVDLGPLADKQLSGFRYLLADDEGEVTHYSGGKPIVDADEFDELDLV